MPVGAHTINPRQHRLRHALLHKHLVEVVTDYRLETGESEHATIEDLTTWSRVQVDPDRDTNVAPHGRRDSDGTLLDFVGDSKF